MKRRTLLQALAGAVCGPAACHREDVRGEVLRSVVERLIVPNTAAVATDSHQLELQVSQLGGEPTVATLHAVRQAFQRALLSWKRADTFRIGPLLEANSLLRAMFWPVRRAGIDALLQGSQPIDDNSIDQMGVDRRGLFALEYLLYAEGPDDEIAARFAGSIGERRALLASALARNVSFYAAGAARSLGDGQPQARRFAEAGQESVNRLVGQLVYTVEHVSANRLTRTATLAKNGALKPFELEGGRSRMSTQIALAYLRAAEDLYRAGGQGLSRLVQVQSGALDSQLRTAFANASSAVSALGAPLEEVAQRSPTEIDAAALIVKKLERALKVELASSLGVTASFSSLDGD